MHVIIPSGCNTGYILSYEKSLTERVNQYLKKGRKLSTATIPAGSMDVDRPMSGGGCTYSVSCTTRIGIELGSMDY